MLKLKRAKKAKGSKPKKENGSGPESLADFDLIPEDIPQELRERLERVVGLARDGHIEEALDIVDDIVDADPMNEDAWKLKGELHSRLGDDVMVELCAL